MKNADGTIKIKRIVFDNAPDFIISVDNWNLEGGYKGLIKNKTINLRNLIRIEGGCMTQEELDNLPEWEG